MQFQNMMAVTVGSRDLDARLSFLDWPLAVIQQLQALSGSMKGEANVLVDELYRRLIRYPEIAAVLGQASTVHRLKKRQRQQRIGETSITRVPMPSNESAILVGEES